MATKIITTWSIFLVAMFLSSCISREIMTNTQSEKQKIYGADTSQFDNTCVSSSKPVSVVMRVWIPEKTDLDHIDRRIRTTEKEKAADDKDNIATESNNNPSGRYITTVGLPTGEPFHIYLDNILKDDGKTRIVDGYVKVKIINNHKNLHYLATIDSATGSVTAAGYGRYYSKDSKPDIVVCSDNTIAPGGVPDSEIFVFYIPIKPTKTGDTITPYNIILKSTSVGDTPIIIDPKIINHG